MTETLNLVMFRMHQSRAEIISELKHSALPSPESPQTFKESSFASGAIPLWVFPPNSKESAAIIPATRVPWSRSSKGSSFSSKKLWPPITFLHFPEENCAFEHPPSFGWV